MYILGISCYYHDAAAVLLKDGLLVAAAEEERFSRNKHDHGFPKLAIEFCLRHEGISRREIDYVVFYEKPLVKFERILMSNLATFPRSWRGFGEAMNLWFREKMWIKSVLKRELGLNSEKVLFSDHHLSHAASAFFASPFDESAILTMDGVGEWSNATWGHGKASWADGSENKLVLSHEQRFPHSLGLLYSAFTAFLGFEVNEGEYKVMGMAPYGNPRYIDKIEKLMTVSKDGSIWLDMSYFSFHYSTQHTFSSKFVDLFGAPRRPDSLFVTSMTDPSAHPSNSDVKQNQYYADIAASIQKVVEDTILTMVNNVVRETGSKRLCMAGGVALNSAANGRILRETPVEELFIQPAAGDSGGALGAALYVYHVLLNQPRKFVQEHSYWGEDLTPGSSKSFLDTNGIAYEEYEDEERLCQLIVDELQLRKVVGHAHGRSEWGPRALGNRSILADPRIPDMKNIINEKIKFREPFRPFAPAILEKNVADYFDGLAQPELQYPARYMLLVMPWKDQAGEDVPAVNHVGTGRLQTVRGDWNPRYNRLIELFGEATGTPIILNTSFNLRGEPMVNTAEDAWNTFSNSGIDILILNNYVIRRP